MRNYKIGTDGIFVRTDSPMLEGWEECSSMDKLKAYATNECGVEAGIRWKGAKIPASLMNRVLGTVKAYPTMEVLLYLYFNLATGEWDVKCPEQLGQAASVSASDNGIHKPGFAKVGTIHTHPGMEAFWSGTDRNDQDGQYGLHIVLGLTDGLVTSYKVTVFTDTARYDQEWDDVIEKVDFKKVPAPDKEWKEIIDRQAYVLPRQIHDYKPRRFGDLDYTGAAGRLWGKHRGDYKPINPIDYSYCRDSHQLADYLDDSYEVDAAPAAGAAMPTSKDVEEYLAALDPDEFTQLASSLGYIAVAEDDLGSYQELYMIMDSLVSQCKCEQSLEWALADAVPRRMLESALDMSMDEDAQWGDRKPVSDRGLEEAW